MSLMEAPESDARRERGEGRGEEGEREGGEGRSNATIHL